MNEKSKATSFDPHGLSRRRFLISAAGGTSAIAFGTVLGTCQGSATPEAAASTEAAPVGESKAAKDSYTMVFISSSASYPVAHQKSNLAERLSRE